ncbi:hypothetical protein PIB30_115771, partial [Stylosanthes scabra]|nr:hypothetical protein [Stylosanthes scabra]
MSYGPHNSHGFKRDEGELHYLLIKREELEESKARVRPNDEEQPSFKKQNLRALVHHLS